MPGAAGTEQQHAFSIGAFIKRLFRDKLPMRLMRSGGSATAAPSVARGCRCRRRIAKGCKQLETGRYETTLLAYLFTCCGMQNDAEGKQGSRGTISLIRLHCRNETTKCHRWHLYELAVAAAQVHQGFGTRSQRQGRHQRIPLRCSRRRKQRACKQSGCVAEPPEA